MEWCGTVQKGVERSQKGRNGVTRRRGKGREQWSGSYVRKQSGTYVRTYSLSIVEGCMEWKKEL